MSISKLFSLDLWKNKPITIDVKQNDTGRNININLKANGEEVDLTGKTVKYFIKKGDGNTVFNNCNIVEGKIGSILVPLTNQAITIEGTNEMELAIYDENGAVESTFTVYLQVTKTLIDDNAIESSNEFKALNDALGMVQGIDNKFKAVNSQLDTITKQQLPLINQFSPFNSYTNNSKPIFSSSFSVGDSTFRPLYSEIDRNIKELAYCKQRGIVFCYHLIIENGIVKIVQLDKTEMEHSEERVDYALTKLKEYNFTIRAIKLHTEFTNIDIDNNSNFWSSYHSCLSRILIKHSDIKLFYILNEVPTITNNPKYINNIINEINYVKSQGKKVSISNMGINELKNNLYNNYVDILSVNLYPFMSVNGLNTSNIECLGSWDNAINELYDVVKKYNKDIIISETGCLDKEESLQAPGDYTVSGNECNGEIKRIFYKGLFNYFEKSFVKEIFLWDGGSYSPYKYNSSLEVMRNNLGGNYIE